MQEGERWIAVGGFGELYGWSSTILQEDRSMNPRSKLVITVPGLDRQRKARSVRS
jgi:hypothetical protein